MGDTERPIPERLGDQVEQAEHLTRTGNGPTVADEEELLAAHYGPPDMAGHYVGRGFLDGIAAAPDDHQGDVPAPPEPADQDEAPAAPAAEGGESA
ncbi:hypothetical protein [Streptomyces seoulensis]|uniref:hypothetical protein n=1 Tax=Streptomyces seoulensis TaxID=73044 RepID=UPI001FCC5E6B|nr:hypothetical protein [Streptomyces seoulensis]BDH04914.1 hypothetical protein HEK131_21410 [Streptomyces seoulensis]